MILSSTAILLVHSIASSTKSSLAKLDNLSRSKNCFAHSRLPHVWPWRLLWGRVRKRSPPTRLWPTTTRLWPTTTGLWPTSWTNGHATSVQWTAAGEISHSLEYNRCIFLLGLFDIAALVLTKMTGETTLKSTNIIVPSRQMTNFSFRELQLVLQCRLKMGHGWDRCKLIGAFSTLRWPNPVPLQVSQNMVPVDCPPGLEYLALIDQLIIKQKVVLQ